MSDYRDRILTALLETIDEGDPAPARPAAGPRLRRGRRRWAMVAAGSFAALALVGVLLALPRGGGGVDIVERAAAAITPAPGTILHYRIDGVRIYTPYAEVWQTTGLATRVRARAQGTDQNNQPCVFEYSVVIDAAGRSEVGSWWNPEAETVHPTRRLTGPPGSFVYPDPFASLQKHLAAGALREAGRATIDGRDAILLLPRDPAGLPEYGRFGEPSTKAAYYVDAETYRPLRWVVDRTADQYYDVTTFEYLPANPANSALVSVEGAHPGAPVSDAALPATCGAG